MKSSQIIPKEEQDRFWTVVRRCIRTFHPGCHTKTLPKAARLRKKVDAMPPEQMELFYHAEPFDVACDLAGNHLDVRKHLTEYLRIRA